MEPVHIGPTWERGADGRFVLPERSLGWQIIDWCEAYLFQPDGPDAGKPWRFTNEQARFLVWWYGIDDRGRFAYRRGMLRRLKGWGKDPMGAALCCVEFVGPCRFSHFDDDGQPVAIPHPAAWVQTAAVSKEQTRNTMTLLPGMLGKKPPGQPQGPAMEEFSIDLGKEIAYANGGRCRIEAVTSSPRALEGGRPTFILQNEPHHWIVSNEGHAMAKVNARNAAKARDASTRILSISNAHNPGEDSVAERDYEAWQKMASGRSVATGVLYDSLEAPPDVELNPVPTGEDGEVTAEDRERARESLRQALLAARGDSVWLDVDALIETIYDPTTLPSEARRFYLNQIVAGEDAWVAPHEWDACRAPNGTPPLKPGDMVTIGVDGSKSNDHTVVMICRVDDAYLHPAGMWDPGERADGEVPMAEVDAVVAQCVELYDVVGLYADYHPFESYVDKWEQDYAEGLCARASERHPVRYDMRGSTLVTTRMVEAYHDGITEREVMHSGDAALAQYHYNARRRPNTYGVTFGKESAFSSRKVDGVAASALAFQARQDYLVLPENRKRQKQGLVGVFFA